MNKIEEKGYEIIQEVKKIIMEVWCETRFKQSEIIAYALHKDRRTGYRIWNNIDNYQLSKITVGELSNIYNWCEEKLNLIKEL